MKYLDKLLGWQNSNCDQTFAFLQNVHRGIVRDSFQACTVNRGYLITPFEPAIFRSCPFEEDGLHVNRQVTVGAAESANDAEAKTFTPSLQCDVFHVGPRDKIWMNVSKIYLIFIRYERVNKLLKNTDVLVCRLRKL